MTLVITVSWNPTKRLSLPDGDFLDFLRVECSVARLSNAATNRPRRVIVTSVSIGKRYLVSCRMPNLAAMLGFSRFRSGSLLLAVTALLTSCAVPDAPAASETQIEERSYRIGVIHALSGEGVTYAVPVGIGVHRAVSDVNQRWSVENRHLELIVEDGECTRRGGLAAARRLVEGGKVSMIYAGSCSSETLGMADYLRENGTILITPMTSSGTGDFAFRNNVSRSAQVRSVIGVFQEQGFRRFALLTNDTPFSQRFRRAYVELLPSIGGEIVADEVVPGGAKIGPPQGSLTMYGQITGTVEEMREFYRSLEAPTVMGPEAAAEVSVQAARIVTAAPDAVIVLPRTVPDAWFLVSVLRAAGYDGPGAMNHVIESEGDILYFRDLIEGFYIPTLKPQPDPDLSAPQDAGFCESDRHCAAAYAGILLMAETLRVCGGQDSTCMRDFLAQHPIWRSRRFGVLDADEEFSKGGDFVVLQILNGQFHPVTPDHLPPQP